MEGLDGRFPIVIAYIRCNCGSLFSVFSEPLDLVRLRGLARVPPLMKYFQFFEVIVLALYGPERMTALSADLARIT
jgi:hypothetical protein